MLGVNEIVDDDKIKSVSINMSIANFFILKQNWPLNVQNTLNKLRKCE